MEPVKIYCGNSPKMDRMMYLLTRQVCVHVLFHRGLKDNLLSGGVSPLQKPVQSKLRFKSGEKCLADALK